MLLSARQFFASLTSPLVLAGKSTSDIPGTHTLCFLGFCKSYEPKISFSSHTLIYLPPLMAAAPFPRRYDSYIMLVPGNSTRPCNLCIAHLIARHRMRNHAAITFSAAEREGFVR